MYLFGMIQALKIAGAYLALIVFLPAFILKPSVKEETVTKRLLIYLVFGNIYISSIVFTLAYLNLFRPWIFILTVLTVSLILYLLLNYQALHDKVSRFKKLSEELILGEYGWNLFIQQKREAAKAKLKEYQTEILTGHKIEWLILLALLGYALYHYGINSLEYMTYSAPDEEVHLYWIQSLIGGELYPSGIYPHIFHSIFAALMVFFNIKGMTMIIYFNLFTVVLIMALLYLGLRKVLKSPYAALFGLMLYLVADIYDGQATYRFQFSIPQEYGMIFLIPMALFLFDYLEKRNRRDLLFFSFSLALAIGSHFYTGIIALILALSIGFVYLFQIFQEKIFGRLILAGLLSAFIALAPMAVGLMAGYELEQSFAWASEVIQGDIYSSRSDGVAKKELTEDEEEKEESYGRPEMVQGMKNDLVNYLVKDLRSIYIIAALMFLSLISNGWAWFVKNDQKSRRQLALTLNSFILLTLILFKALDLPTIMEPKRLAIYFAYFSPLFMALPLEWLNQILANLQIKGLALTASLASMIASLGLIYTNAWDKKIPEIYYFQPTGTILSNYKIMEEFEDKTWTVISPVTNIPLVMNRGFHYELDEFIFTQENDQSDASLRIPTKEVFLYLEKQPIINYGDRFNPGDYELRYRPRINPADALKELSESPAENYYYIEERDILMAKAQAWARNYQKYHASEMSIYYEDPELIVYRIEQNESALNDFKIDQKKIKDN